MKWITLFSSERDYLDLPKELKSRQKLCILFFKSLFTYLTEGEFLHWTKSILLVKTSLCLFLNSRESVCLRQKKKIPRNFSSYLWEWIDSFLFWILCVFLSPSILSCVSISIISYAAPDLFCYGYPNVSYYAAKIWY